MKTYDLVVIGGGSGGIAAAVSAFDNGVKSILLLEKEGALGGILLQCIHNGFGLQTFKEELTGPEYAYRVAKELLDKGIEYKVNTFVTEISKDLVVSFTNEVDGFVQVQAKAIVCATGCSERTRGAIAIPGDRPTGVMTAGQAQKYLNIEGYMVGKKVFILGSGDIGLIMARRMTLEGAKVLGVAELMPYSNGLNRNIVQCLNDYNIPLYLSHTVKQIIGHERLEKIILSKVDEKFNYVPGTEMEIECDTLLLSVGLIPSNPLLENIGVAIHPRTKGPIVDESYQTSISGIFACGNSLHVHDLVDFVSAEGAKAGAAAAHYLKGELNKGDSLSIKIGPGVGYVLPSKANLSNIEQLAIFFRCSAPHKNCSIKVTSNGEVIKTFKRPYMVPSEMETIKLPVSLLEEATEINVEVADD